MLKITDPNLLNELPQNNRFIGTLPTLDNSSIIFNGKIIFCTVMSMYISQILF